MANVVVLDESGRPWEGYRTWEVKFHKDKPRLHAVTQSTPWIKNEEGEIVSSFKGTKAEFKKSTEGFYSVNDPKRIQYSGLPGVIYPYGIVYPNTEGWRSTKAQVVGLEFNPVGKHYPFKCDICSKSADWVVEDKESNSAIPVCDRCRGKIDKLVRKLEREGLGKVHSLEDIRRELLTYYEAQPWHIEV